MNIKCYAIPGALPILKTPPSLSTPDLIIFSLLAKLSSNLENLSMKAKEVGHVY